MQIMLNAKHRASVTAMRIRAFSMPNRNFFRSNPSVFFPCTVPIAMLDIKRTATPIMMITRIVIFSSDTSSMIALIISFMFMVLLLVPSVNARLPYVVVNVGDPVLIVVGYLVSLHICVVRSRRLSPVRVFDRRIVYSYE